MLATQKFVQVPTLQNDEHVTALPGRRFLSGGRVAALRRRQFSLERTFEHQIYFTNIIFQYWTIYQKPTFTHSNQSSNQRQTRSTQTAVKLKTLCNHCKHYSCFYGNIFHIWNHVYVEPL